MTEQEQPGACSTRRLLAELGLRPDVLPDLDAWASFVDSVTAMVAAMESSGVRRELRIGTMAAEMAALQDRLRVTSQQLGTEQTTMAQSWHRQRALAQLGRRAVEGAAVSDMLRSAVDLAASAMQAPVATIFELTGGANLALRAGIGWGEGVPGLIPIAPDSQASFVVQAPTGSVVVGHLERETRFTPARLLLDKGVRSCVAARIGSAADPFGIVSVYSDRTGHFGHEDEIFINELAHVLTLAIERDRHAGWLAQKAYHDDLTGLANRVLLADRLVHAIGRSRRTGAAVRLLLIDLDGFKVINDSRGHAAGDRLLVDVARRLEEGLRGGDLVARIGGDEFAVLVEEASPGEAVATADRILEILRAPFAMTGGDVFVRASVGIADNDRAVAEPGELLVRADLAMYAAKAGGGDQHRTFTPDMQQELHRRHQVHADLQQALARHELRVHYQPIIDLATGELASLEALVRWEHPSRGLVGPDVFLAIADETNLIGAIGRVVLDEACRQLAQWHAASLVGRNTSIAVNVAARQLYAVDFCAEVGQALTVAGLPASNLVLEMTESSLFANTASVHERLEGLRALGVGIAIDDFGTGYSSLAYLHTFPVDLLKIDKTFVQRLHDGAGRGSEAALMIRSIVGLGHNLGLRIVAEGIERAEEQDAVIEAGCDLGQGYLLGRPLSAAGTTDFLERRHLARSDG